MRTQVVFHCQLVSDTPADWEFVNPAVVVRCLEFYPYPPRRRAPRTLQSVWLPMAIMTWEVSCLAWIVERFHLCQRWPASHKIGFLKDPIYVMWLWTHKCALIERQTSWTSWTMPSGESDCPGMYLSIDFCLYITLNCPTVITGLWQSKMWLIS